MKKSQKIGWQKYEDVLDGQINCPLAQQLYQNVMESMNEDLLNSTEMQEIEEHEFEEATREVSEEIRVVLDKDFSKELLLATNYDCWMGHTNFDITPKIKDELNCIAGVEIMKICTRYRFFIGIGRMFDFSDVRKEIEDKLNTTKEE
tara:strand:- start:4752 stop:5192 length:441 start_codon:yes stop_codon:yes gene_type:complete